MVIKIVTDSTADLPEALYKELDIAVVPEYLRFGDQVYRDHVDINEDEFYQRLIIGPIHPKTAQPTPQDFANVYRTLCQNADGIISIHLTSKLSGTFNSAQQGKNIISTACPIELIDSKTLSIALGLIVMQAAKMAKAGMSLKQITDEVYRIMPHVHFLILFDTLKYLAKGGRIGKAKAFLGSLLNVKPVLTVKDGEFVPSGQVRTRSRGIDLLLEFVKNAREIQELAVLYSTTADEARLLVERLGSIWDKDRIILSRVGPALGVHGGPGVLAIALRQK
jgi:DegV family protein with EDD domain